MCSLLHPYCPELSKIKCIERMNKLDMNDFKKQWTQFD